MNSVKQATKNIDKSSGISMATNSDFCCCCGSTFRWSDSCPDPYNKGITCYPGYIAKPKAPHNEIKRIKTKNGWLTFALKVKKDV